MNSALGLLLAIGLVLVFALTDRTLEVRYRWLRRKLYKQRLNRLKKRLHRLQCLYNPRSEAMRTFTKS